MRIATRPLLPLRTLALAAATTTLLSTVISPANAQSSLSSNGSSLGSSKISNQQPIPPKMAQDPIRMPNGTTVQIMGDVLGPWSRHVGFGAGDLGTMAPLKNGVEFAMIFGDSFRGNTVGDGAWMSPVGVVAKMVNGQIQIVRPLNNSNQVYDLIHYYREEGDTLTLIPSDVININGSLYMQAMWVRNIGGEGGAQVEETQIWRSDNDGKRWQSVGTTSSSYMSGLGNLLSWEQGPDGYIYAVSTSFKRADPVYLARFTEADMSDRSAWELYDPSTGKWGTVGDAILSGPDIKAGEMNLRYIEGQWVLAMFNEATLAIEIRISDTLAQNWNDIPAATVAKHGEWYHPQTPLNWSQPYGGYIVPGSSIGNLDIVISQWNTGTNKRYMATQFNVKGLDTFFGVESSGKNATENNGDITVTEESNPQHTDDMNAEDQMLSQKPKIFSSSGASQQAQTAMIVLGVLAGVGALVAVAWPMLKQVLPPQLQQLLP